MRESYLAGAYWGCRPESAEVCAQRAETFFRLLSECHPSYAYWFEQARSTRRALQLQFEPTRDAFLRFFGQEKYRMGQDGFSFSAWTGHVAQDQGGQVRLRCGGDAKVAPNSVRLAFPLEDLGREHLLTASTGVCVMRALAIAWEPDWALVTSDALWDEFSRQGDADTFLGWMTYLSRRRGELPSLGDAVRVESVEDKGHLILLAPERFSSTDTEHVALGHRVQRALEERGLLGKLSRP
jgi:hypothetical protein